MDRKEGERMKLIFTCGGTAGHIYPAVAVANLFRSRHPEAEILFVGAKGKMETELVPREGYDIRAINISSFSRARSLAGLKHNLTTLHNLSLSKKQARRILDEFCPDAVVGTGGYASYPVIREAARRGIPTAIHESNAVPGLTTKVLSRQVDTVMVAFEESRSGYDCPEKVIVTGTPVRGEFALAGKPGHRDKPLVLSFWGSLGASGMNRHMAECMALECADGSFRHIHATGKGNLDVFREQVRAAGGSPEQLEIREYIFDMPSLMAEADLIVCRAGASTLAELTAAGKASVLVPSPYVTNNHQERNARVLEAAGAAAVLTEEESSGEELYRTITRLLNAPGQRENMARAARALAVDDAAERIYEQILHLTER